MVVREQQQQLAIGVGVEGNKNLSGKCYFFDIL